MMTNIQNKSSEKEPKEKWYLKIDDGSVFGPAPVLSLRSWAEQGRVHPGHMLSTDRKEWIPAENIKELEMFWDVELNDGTTFGPLNIKAIADLSADGTVSPGSKITNRQTQESSSVMKMQSAIYGASKPMTTPTTTNSKQSDTATSKELKDLKVQLSTEKAQHDKDVDEITKHANHSETKAKGLRKEGELSKLISKFKKKGDNLQSDLSIATANLEKTHENVDKINSINNAKQKELNEKIEVLNAKAEVMLSNLVSAKEALQKERESHQQFKQESTIENKQLAQELQQFKQILIDEASDLSQEVVKGREITESIQAILKQRENAVQKRTLYLQELTGMDIEQQKQLLAKRKEAVATLSTLEKDLSTEQCAREQFENTALAQAQELDVLKEKSKNTTEQHKTRLLRADQETQQLQSVISELKHRGQKSDIEISHRIDELQDECKNLTKLHDDAVADAQQKDKELTHQRSLSDTLQQDIEQERMFHEDEQEHNSLKTEDIQQRLDQVQQEHEAIAVRLEQQKKFYDEEREQRRQRELELLEQKKTVQDISGTMRHKDQLTTQQKKQHEDELMRWKHKEQVLSRRIDQLQRDWRSASSKQEETQRELMHQKKQMPSEQSKACIPRKQVARRSIIAEQTAATERKLTDTKTGFASIDPTKEEDAIFEEVRGTVSEIPEPSIPNTPQNHHPHQIQSLNRKQDCKNSIQRQAMDEAKVEN